jgi:hypothetical protein
LALDNLLRFRVLGFGNDEEDIHRVGFELWIGKVQTAEEEREELFWDKWHNMIGKSGQKGTRGQGTRVEVRFRRGKKRREERTVSSSATQMARGMILMMDASATR